MNTIVLLVALPLGGIWSDAFASPLDWSVIADLEPTAPQSMAAAVESHHPRAGSTAEKPPASSTPLELALKGIRLPGPSHWGRADGGTFRCNICSNRSCEMYLSYHLNVDHGVDVSGLTAKQLHLIHDNIHNSNAKWRPSKSAAKPKPAVTRQIISQPTYYQPTQQPRLLQRLFCRGCRR